MLSQSATLHLPFDLWLIQNGSSFKYAAMSHPVTPLPDLIAGNAQSDTYEEPEGWAGLPGDLLHRISWQLDSKYDVTSILATCRQWHISLKAALTSLRVHFLGEPALQRNFSSVRLLDASLWRRTAFGMTYLTPVCKPDKLAFQFPSLVSLNMSGQHFGKRGLYVLQQLAGRLQHLDCSGCELGVSDMSALAKLSHLTSLVLNCVRAAPVQQPANAATLLAVEFVAITVPTLTKLHHLELCLQEDEQQQLVPPDPHHVGGLVGFGGGAQPQPQPLHGPGGAGAPNLQHQGTIVSGLPMLKLLSHLTALRELR